MKLNHKHLLALLILISLFTFCKKEDNYPVVLIIAGIEKGPIKAYTLHDSIVPNRYRYNDVADSVLFNATLTRKIIFKSHNSASMSIGNENTGYLNLNASISYINDSIIFRIDDTIDGYHFSDEMHGVGDESGVVLSGTSYVKRHKYGLEGYIVYKYININTLKNELGANDTLVYFNLKLNYK